jgi:hypothetical protein
MGPAIAKEKEMTQDTDTFVALVDRMTKLCWGRVPDKAHDADVVHALVAVCFPPQDATVQNALALELAQALDLLRRQQTCIWQN